MIFKLIIFAAIGIFIYKILGGELPKLGKKTDQEKKKSESDTLVECKKCGTYVTIEEVTLIGGKYYCNECI